MKKLCVIDGMEFDSRDRSANASTCSEACSKALERLRKGEYLRTYRQAHRERENERSKIRQRRLRREHPYRFREQARQRRIAQRAALLFVRELGLV